MNEIIELIGLEAALKLCNAFAGCRLYIPKHDAIIKRAKRNELIKADKLAGETIRSIAIKYQLTDRQILSILG